MKRTAVFPGSFDPPTLGHLDIIHRALAACDRLIVSVGHNPHKDNGVFSADERVEMITKMVAAEPSVEVRKFSGLVVDFAAEVGADYLVRGLRAFSDFEYEFKMALANRKMSGLETLFLMADSRHAHISSSLIRDIGRYGRDLSEFVPEAVHREIVERLQVH